MADRGNDRTVAGDQDTTASASAAPSTVSFDPTSASSNPTLSPQERANADNARHARESLRASTPENNQSVRVNPYGGSPYQVARYPEALGQPVQVLRLTTHITSDPNLPPTAVDALTDSVHHSIDHNLNQGHQFANGDWVMVDIVPVADPNDADLHLDLTTTTTELAGTVRQHLGLPPQSTPGFTPNDIRQLAADIDQATMTGAHQPSWADPHTTAPETPVETEHTVDLDAIHNTHAEQTPAGISHHRGDPTMGDLPHRVPADPTRFTADTHITPDGHAVIGNQTLTPEQYGDLLRRTHWDGTTPIRLIGCDASTNGFADRLAQHLGVEVLAPTQAAWTDTNGNVFSTSAITNPDGTRSPRVPPDGQWQSHHPTGTTASHGTDATAPGATPNAVDAESAVDRSRPATSDTPPPGHETPFGDRRDDVRDRITPPRRVINSPLLDPNNPDHVNARGTLRPDEYPLPVPPGNPTNQLHGQTPNGAPFTDTIYGDPPAHTTVRDYHPRIAEYPRRTGGTFTALRHEQQVIFPPDADGNVQSFSRSQVGDNVVLTESLNGRHVATTGVVRHDFSTGDAVNRDRDSAEATAATNVGHEGVAPPGTNITHDGGHASSYRTTLDRGLVNLFAQESEFNQRQFRVLENAIADWPRSRTGRETHIDFRTDPPGSVTPETVIGTVTMVDSRGEVYRELILSFSNRGGNSFTRKEHEIQLRDFRKYDEHQT
ncbi:hypothetical protein FNL39_101657 [Nocardia caishijiensis]|uniref:DNA/RNA non-specific endonuclease n=2 Tax=Nocardia caishijiensis TaxID=184756 RepID=A0ABQ6YTY2_9NOCA|nr:hypothetical protein FNL39_101657 [Nocardia caishijiensis]